MQQDNSSNPVSDRVSSVAESCLSADISALPCDEENPTGLRPDPTFFQVARAVLTFGIENQNVLPPVQLLTTARGDERLAKEFRQAMKPVIKEISAKISRDHLDSCHSACLVQCLTSQLLTYDDEQYDSLLVAMLKKSADHGPDYAGGSGKGVCRNYANLAEEIGAAVGMNLDPVTVRGGNHAMIEYREGDRLFLLEPQSNPLKTHRCTRKPI